MTEEMSKKVIEFTQDYYKYSLRNDDKFCIERYVDYRDEFPESDIDKILTSDKPLEMYDQIIMDWEIQCDDWYYEDEFFSQLKSFCEENEIEEIDARNVVYETFSWVYPDSFLNPDVSTMWIINHGDMNHDFVYHNILNYAADYGYCDGLEKPSGLWWLAKQQGKLTELKHAIAGKSSKHYFSKYEYSEFTESCITELENCSHCMTALQFMVKMPLQQIIEIKQKIADMENNKEFNTYYPADCKKDFGYILLDKSTMCGLFESCGDGGSLMEIKLEKDVKLPLKYLWDIRSNKNFQKCCGVDENCWNKTIKEIKLKEVA